MTTLQLGQYFTISEDLQNKCSEFILNDPKTILEPSYGKGHLVIKILEKLPTVEIIAYEIDKSLEPIIYSENIHLTYCDFLQHNIPQKFPTIVGNPPYVKTPSGNLYLKFIEKCVELLENSGELIFIVPSDFLKATSARDTILYMTALGSFTHIYFPNKENLFKGANIDVMTFRYQKGLFNFGTIKINDRCMYTLFSDGIITFHESPPENSVIVRDIFHVYVGMVSGKEEVFKNEIGNVKILTDKEVQNKYILIDSFPSSDDVINKYLLECKQSLVARKIRKFNSNNWWEWGALRNINIIRENIGRPCIYVYNLTRKSFIAFKSTVQLFGGNLLLMIPKSDEVDLEEVVNFLNSSIFKKNYTYSNRFKIGHKQLYNAVLCMLNPKLKN